MRSVFRPSSIRTVFLLVMTMLIMVLSLPLLYFGIRIMDRQIGQYGMELLQSELGAQLDAVDRRYATLARIGLEDSQVHRLQIRDAALQAFAAYRYKKSGRMFVIDHQGRFVLPPDSANWKKGEKSPFFDVLVDNITPLRFRDGAAARLAVVRYYQPWDSYVGLSMEEKELFAPRRLFVRINLGLLALVLGVAVVFARWLQQNLVTPIISLTRYAARIREGDFSARPHGTYILELAALRDDLREMVSALQQRMLESREQVTRIREREQELARLLRELRASEEKYREVFNAPEDAIIVHDAQTGALLDANRGAEKMYGYTLDELRRKSVVDLSEQDPAFGPDAVQEKIGFARRQGRCRFEWRARHAGGRIFWVEVSLHPCRFGEKQVVIAVVRDIDRRKEAELRLAREREQLSVTLRSIGDGVITTDLDGRVVLVNRVAEELTGWSQDEAAGRQLSEVMRLVDERNDRPRPDPAALVLESGRIVEMANHTLLLDRSGQRRAIADSAAPIIGPDRRMIGVVVVFRDVTEKNRLEQELLKIKKLESVGVLAGGIAHDFNNILTAIQGNISLARARLQVPDFSRERLDETLARAEKASAQAKNLTGQLLTFAKGGDPVKQTASVEEIIRESAQFVLRGSPIQARFSFADDLRLVEVDPGQISQVIQNIVLNARQAMQDGGEIRIRAENHDGGEGKRTGMQGPGVRIHIQDNGPGIPPELQEKIFDPYFTTKADGSGLGLAICHSILDKHGGSISVSSVSGQGSCFTLVLPAAVEDNLPVAAGENSPATPEPMPARILLMDDEEMIRDLATGMLELLGHRVVAVDDGRAALAAYLEAMEAGDPFDLVIMDLTVPGGMGGREAMARLRKIDPRVKAVVSSGYANDPVIAGYRRYGFIATMAKPYGLETLREVLARVLEENP